MKEEMKEVCLHIESKQELMTPLSGLPEFLEGLMKSMHSI